MTLSQRPFSASRPLSNRDIVLSHACFVEIAIAHLLLLLPSRHRPRLSPGEDRIMYSIAPASLLSGLRRLLLWLVMASQHLSGRRKDTEGITQLASLRCA